MQKTLLLCFIHGFKGGEDTFGSFPEHLRALASHALPNITIKAVVYPKFETRGDLKECVEGFRTWLQDRVIELEIAASTPSPTVNPSVHTILIGHSMGGIVAAETLLAITSDTPIAANSTAEAADLPPSMAAHTDHMSQHPRTPEYSTLMFPFIQGILAFDTPYLGISPGVVAHGAEQHYKSATGAYSALSEVAGVFGYGASKKESTPKQHQDNQKLLTQGADAMSASMTNASSDAAATPTWQRWGKYTMFAGIAGAVAAGGAAAYVKRDAITEGWSFIGSHLEFVGCLAKGEELKGRLDRLVKLNKDRGVGFADLITVLSKAAVKDTRHGTAVPASGGSVEIGTVDGIAPSERTFCTIPKSERNRKYFQKTGNDKARDEMAAHMTMFTPQENTGYFTLGERARDLIVEWVDPERSEWYKESEVNDVLAKKDTRTKGEIASDKADLELWVKSLRSGRFNKETLLFKAGNDNRSVPISPVPRRSTLETRLSNRSKIRLELAAARPKPPKLGRPKKEILQSKAENGQSSISEDSGPSTPSRSIFETVPMAKLKDDNTNEPQRSRSPKLGKLTNEMVSKGKVEADDNGDRSRPETPADCDRNNETIATSMSGTDTEGAPIASKPPKLGRPRAEMALIRQMGVGDDRPKSPRPRPPKLGRPKAETRLKVIGVGGEGMDGEDHHAEID